MKVSDKYSAQLLAEIMRAKGIKEVVFSPGSRNAPLINTFASSPGFKCYTIVDERSAAFFALGMAIQSGRTVAIACTSGSAMLNYAPAIAEAYYQKIPLLVLTADRPAEWIDQGDGQTIRQRDAFRNFIRGSYELPQHPETADSRWMTNRLVNEAINKCRFPVPGPVHINLPFAEPLYGITETEPEKPRIIHQPNPKYSIADADLRQFADLINNTEKVMLLAGQNNGDIVMNDALRKIAALPQCILLTENISNLKNENGVGCIDKLLSVIGDRQKDFAPTLLITFGEAVVSKRIKTFLRKHKPTHHLHANAAPDHTDTYQCLTQSIQTEAAVFFDQLAPLLQEGNSNYHQQWKEQCAFANRRHNEFLKQCPFTDFKAYALIFDELPLPVDLHQGNSSPVRYGQLFDHPAGMRHFANRGTSGIDGCLSTAAGAAHLSGNLTVAIVGDLSFFYDSNALWNNYLNKNLRIIVINNGGGNIFRIIPGPSDTDHLETIFEARHQRSAIALAKSFDIKCFEAADEQTLAEVLPAFLDPTAEAPALLEIRTDGQRSAMVLNDYFKYLETGSFDNK
jgi:2-succinyl-5-enolpyruvyl-6-hydroxy-3-cyclohexene-1-carboxylate synthase